MNTRMHETIAATHMLCDRSGLTRSEIAMAMMSVAVTYCVRNHMNTEGIVHLFHRFLYTAQIDFKKQPALGEKSASI